MKHSTILFTIALCSTNVFAMKKIEPVFEEALFTQQLPEEKLYYSNEYGRLKDLWFQYEYGIRSQTHNIEKFLNKKMNNAKLKELLFNEEFYRFALCRTHEGIYAKPRKDLTIIEKYQFTYKNKQIQPVFLITIQNKQDTTNIQLTGSLDEILTFMQNKKLIREHVETLRQKKVTTIKISDLTSL